MSAIINKRVLSIRNVILMFCVVGFLVIVISLAIPAYIIFKHKETEDIKPDHLNILFIVVDDLRPTLGCYGDAIAITPNIDQLASRGVLFSNAYAQQALCAPSRTSLLTSRRPDTLHLYSNTGSYWRRDIWNFTTLPQHFKAHGYETVSFGKVFHHGDVSNMTDDFPYSWSEMPFHPSSEKYKMKKVCQTPNGKFMNLVCPVDVSTQPDHTLPDLETTQSVINYLNKSKESFDKLFLAVGLHKPHIPLKFPQEYLDLYPIDAMNLAPHNTRPKGMPDVAWNPWTDLRERDDVKQLNLSFPYEPIPNDFQKKIRQNYYASVSYIDEQVGWILEALEESGCASHTAIVFIGDHGWSLGEHGEWSKYSNFDVSLKVPMILHVPDLTDGPKKKKRVPFKHIPVLRDKDQNSTMPKSYPKAKYIAREFVELVDLFPTLSELAKLAIPMVCSLHSNMTDFCSEGVSMYPIIRNYLEPSIAFSWKSAVFSQYPRPSYFPQEDSDQPVLSNITIMGYTIRNEYFRYTRWVRFDNKLFKPHWGTFEDHELYDLTQDADEINNLASDPEYARTILKLFTDLKAGWREALPFSIFGSPSRKVL